jgi:hypothetical protein
MFKSVCSCGWQGEYSTRIGAGIACASHGVTHKHAAKGQKWYDLLYSKSKTRKQINPSDAKAIITVYSAQGEALRVFDYPNR